MKRFGDCRGAPVRNLRIVYAAGVARETILGDPWRAQEHEKFILRIQEAPSAPREMIFGGSRRAPELNVHFANTGNAFCCS